MSNGHHLHRQLLEQARHLATRERRRPRQGSLRRAVSTAYYALFHLIVHEAAQKLLRGNAAEPLRPLLGRAFVHGDMKAAARSFAGGTLPATIKAYQPGPVSAELRQVAEAFVVLQELRHQADYDLRARLGRRETLDLVETAEAAFAAWSQVRASQEGLLYLVCSLSWKQLSGR